MEGPAKPNRNIQESPPAPKVEVESEFTDFVPQAFLVDPSRYFEREGKNIKTGEIKYDEAGVVREDPTAVKDLPVWTNAEGKEIHTVGRRVNPIKGAVGKSGDPFYEYKILERLIQMGLPAAKPVAKAEQAGTHIIVMERIPGIRWSEKESLELKERGYSEEDITALMTETEDVRTISPDMRAEAERLLRDVTEVANTSDAAELLANIRALRQQFEPALFDEAA